MKVSGIFLFILVQSVIGVVFDVERVPGHERYQHHDYRDKNTFGGGKALISFFRHPNSPRLDI